MSRNQPIHVLAKVKVPPCLLQAATASPTTPAVPLPCTDTASTLLMSAPLPRALHPPPHLSPPLHIPPSSRDLCRCHKSVYRGQRQQRWNANGGGAQRVQSAMCSGGLFGGVSTTHCSIVVHGRDTLLLSGSATVAKRQQPPPFWEAAPSLRTLDEDGAVDVCRLQRRDECVQLWLRGICVREGHVRQLPRHLRPRPAACTGAAVAGCLPALTD